MNNYIIKMKGIKKYFYGVKALDGVDFKIKIGEGEKRIRSLLHKFQADTISVGSATTSSDMISMSVLLAASKEEMTIVCLGAPDNIVHEIEKGTDIVNKIEEIIWYNDSKTPIGEFPEKYNNIVPGGLADLGVDINIISSLNNASQIIDNDLINLCKEEKTLLGTTLFNIHEKSPDHLKSNSREELTAIYLMNPELFEMDTREDKVNIHFNINHSIPSIREVVTDMISGRYKSGHFVAFYGFPADRELYVYDIRQIMDSAIIRYGIDEWKACVMTDEFHGHLGVFSIVGAKMGIYAREYFGIGTDLLEINTYAGSIEPYSCMNDGLQVSTGATLGQGSIHLINDTIAKPQAVFTYHNLSILIKLKSEYLQELQAVIGEDVRR